MIYYKLIRIFDRVPVLNPSLNPCVSRETEE